MSKHDTDFLNQLDREIYSLLPGRPESSKAGDELLLISAALRLLNIVGKRLERCGGGVLATLEFNNIYSRPVTLPADLETGEYPLLLVFDAESHTPYLIHREGQRNRLLMVRNGRTCPVSMPWPALSNTAHELHRSFRDQISGVTEIVRLAYQPELKAVGLLLLISLIVLGFSLSIPILTNTLVSSVLPQSDLGFLAESLLVVALIVVASISSQYIQGLMILRLETVGNQRLQLGVWEHFLKLPASFTADLSRGDIYVGLSAISRIRQYVGAGALTSALSAVFSFAFLGLMVSYSSSLATWMILLVAVVLLIVFQIARQAVQVNQRVFELKGQLNSMSYEMSGNALSIRAMAAEVPMLRRWMRRFTGMANASIQLDVMEQSIDVILNSLSPLGSVLLFAVAVAQVLSSPESIGDPKLIGSFVAFYSAFTAFSSSISDAAANLTDVFSKVSVLWSKATVILDAPIEPGWGAENPNHRFQGGISLKDVEVKPSGLREPLLNQVSLNIEPGSIVAITGKKASGKSLLLKASLGLMPVNNGEVLIDGLPLSKIASRGLRRQVGYIPQEVVLEPLTLRELLLDNRQEREDILWAMLQAVDLDHCISALPHQLETELSGNGAPLSRSERKLLALARALLRRPAALLLDELLVGIPEQAHDNLLHLIREQGCTVLLVASHWSELSIADTTVLLEDGAIRLAGKAGTPGLSRQELDLL